MQRLRFLPLTFYFLLSTFNTPLASLFITSNADRTCGPAHAVTTSYHTARSQLHPSLGPGATATTIRLTPYLLTFLIPARWHSLLLYLFSASYLSQKEAWSIMGQNASTQRDRAEIFNRDSRRFSQLVRDGEAGNSAQPRSWTSNQGSNDEAPSLSPTPSHAQDSHTPQPIATFSRQISAQSIPVLRGGVTNSRDISTRDDIFYEHHEERPLADMEDLGMRDAPITHITASPMPRRSSRISRFTSMMMPRYATGGASEDEHIGYREGHSSQRRLSNANPSNTTNESEGRRSRHLSILGSLSSRSSGMSRPRRRSDLAPISRPFPLSADASLPPSGLTTSSLQDTVQTRNISADSGGPPSRFLLAPIHARLSRVRRSISSPFGAFFSPTRNPRPQEQISQTPPRRPSRLAANDDPDYLLPPLNVTEPDIGLNEQRLASSIALTREQRPSVISTVPVFPERATSRVDGPSWTERWAERGASGRREGRRMPSMLRGRSSRLIRRDNDGPLPRILHLAATAIAAQLSGTPEHPVPDMQAVGPEDLDGSLHNLFRTLQNATTTTTTTSSSSSSTREVHSNEGGNDTTHSAGNLPPLNFLRVFRFVSHNTNTAALSGPPDNERLGGQVRSEARPPVGDDASDDTDGRTVTLVVVGVRSVPSDNVATEDINTAEPTLDSILNVPPWVQSTNGARTGAGGLLRHANGRARFPHRRRASVGALNPFPANYNNEQHQRTMSSNRQGSTDLIPATGSSTPLVLSESPPGPHPPPSTPADPGLSSYSSGTTTPSRRPSSASAAHQPHLAPRELATQHLREAGILTPGDQIAGTVQQRRRSDSEFARHRDLGAGAARRNGVVEPDAIDSGDTPATGSRSWLIYVVGTNLSEDHPALTTPSLFTDVCHLSFLLEKFLLYD